MLRKYFERTCCNRPFNQRIDIKARNCMFMAYHLIKDKDQPKSKSQATDILLKFMRAQRNISTMSTLIEKLIDKTKKCFPTLK